MASPLVRRLLLARRADDVEKRGLDPDVAILFALDDVLHESHVWRRSPAAARRAVAESIAIVEGALEEGRAVDVCETTFAAPEGARTARVYTPAALGPEPSPGLVYLHGGGWVTCDLDTHDSLCRRFAREGRLRVVSIDYRLAPEHRFPAAVDDATAAFRWVAGAARELGIDPARIAVGGDSAGGNLAAVVGLETRGDAVRPALQVLLYPALDGTMSKPSHTTLAEGYYLTARACEWYYRHYVGDDRARRADPRVSPLLADDLAGAPPALVAIAGFDPLRDEADAYVARLREAGVKVARRMYDAFPHGFALMTGPCVEPRAATREIAAATGRLLRGE